MAFYASMSLFIVGCHFDFSLTANPTRPIDNRLVGDWVYVDVDGQRIERMNVRKLDATTFIVSYEGELYRAFHSDFAGVSFISVQDLHSDPGKFLYLVYKLSSDDAKLGLKYVNPKFVPETVKDQAAIQEFIKRNLNNPSLFGEELVYSRRKDWRP